MSVNEPTLQNVVPSKISKNEIPSMRAYVESPALNPTAMDVLNQFRANMSTLEDLNGRLSFMMTEIRGLIRK
jgi:hypothetical protein